MTNLESPVLSYQNRLRPFVPLRLQSIFVVSALGMCLLAKLATLIFGFQQLGLLERAKAGIRPTHAEAAANDLRYGGAHIALFVTMILTFVFLLLWMYRAHKNLQAITDEKLRFTPGGAVGWWFCPIANLGRPYQVMREIMDVSRHGSRRGMAVLLGFWWGFWIVSNLLARVSVAFSDPQNSTIDTLITQTWANMIDFPFTIIAGLLLIYIILVVDRAQEQERNIVRT